ncbi:MAG: hypothetical protein GTO14_17030 [Anaerolineales bacterium]|nr:hypothetical protein [Anaerolineales bacterium]
MIVGKIIHSNAHTDYVCQVYRKDEVENPPAREDFAIGSFVRLHLADDQSLVGLVYDTRLFNPEFGRLGPRLSPEADLEVFAPDYLSEKATLIGIAAVGTIDGDGPHQGFPPLAVDTDAMVETMPDEEIRAFHLEGDALRLAYAPLLLASGSPHALHLIQTVLERLSELLPEHAETLALLKDDVSWKAAITPLGGDR